VDDHLGVLGVVDAALAERDVGLRVTEERVVAAELVDTDGDLPAVDRRQGRAEAEALDVPLCLRDPVVRHHLLELVLVARVEEARAGVRRGQAGLALDRDVRAAERRRAHQVGERDEVVRTPQHRLGAEEVGVLLVGEALDAEVGDRVRREHAGGRRRGSRGRDRGERLARDGGDERHHDPPRESMHTVLLRPGPGTGAGPIRCHSKRRRGVNEFDSTRGRRSRARTSEDSMPDDHVTSATPPQPVPSWPEIAGGIGNALGGLILALQAAVLVPGLLPFAALTAVVLVPFLVLGALLALAVAVVVGVWRAAVGLRRRR
jgi:hypothetical protein